MTRIKRCAAIALVLVIMLSMLSPIGKAATPIAVQVKEYEEFKQLYTKSIEFSPGEEPYLINGRVMVPFRTISQMLGCSVDYDPITKIVTVSGSGGMQIVLTLGSRQALFNDRVIELDVVPEAKNGVTFVPLRFITECFDAVVDWNGEKRLVTIGNYYISHKEFLFDKRDSRLYLRDQTANKKHTFLTRLDFDIDWPGMDVVTTGQGNFLIRIGNSHGAPHVFFDTYDVYVANGKVIAEGHFGTAYYYPGNMNPVISADGTKIVIANNTYATVYDDSTLEVVAEYDLVEMFGIDPGLDDEIFDDENKEERTFYDVVACGENYLVVKSGLSKRMAVAHLDTGEIVWLYKIFYSDPIWLEYIEWHPSFTEDRGDGISFIEEKDGQLIFEGIEWNTKPYLEFSYDLNG